MMQTKTQSKRIRQLASSLVLAGLFISSHSLIAQDYKPVEGKIMTKWAEQVNPKSPLPEYPRPQLKRSQWQNLNGLWQYAITNAAQDAIPTKFDGKILVPYPVESALSGVGKTVGEDHALWYNTVINQKNISSKERLLLHFGAVDWRTDVYVNGKKVGRHEGGYDPFSFDITPYLQKGKTQQISIRVWDPTDKGPQPRGKQVSGPNGIWYTPVTGIWQTVWTELVPETYIVSTKQTPDLDASSLMVSANVIGAQNGDQVKFVALDKGEIVAQTTATAGTTTNLSIKTPHNWSPTDPHLYQLQITVLRKGKQIDAVSSYFAMRKSSLVKDSKGITRMGLNNKPIFQFGPLDQGWWPDGLYTAPTDEALLFDIEQTKKMGFNMIRKHIKIEPARWYYYCDSLGMLVWQDMPSGDLGGNTWDNHPGISNGLNRDKQRSAASEGYYRKEWKAMIDATYNFPSIVVWTPFNEAWGQFKTVDITKWTKNYDPSRLVNSASGGNFFWVGDMLDLHNYPDPAMPDPEVFGKSGMALVLGEFGGLGLPISGHTWQQNDNWGYQSFKNQDELLKRYSQLIQRLKKLIPLGLSAAVYTQTTDVEVETNGIMTYDRKVIKMPEDKLHDLHAPLYQEEN
ncbi:Glycosyl hydrolases family 2, TIM barrel domain [Arachidicoccus rhizosphaerae]|uniref:Glycosyl hydrolases family 2, TIM barrel domain n=1 Tax=Arachidicoccus rhizosphaerae TaxID=551991 RepID=A0A1H3WH24_9BACT|nr:sugar-binding domain-containing protein [Arachidicoccus rhizosphaerae]SDZ86240.1 Glycosyl hydrolases family 2, TIM barrel domain [Arachidicoccus rhizosphaerae]